MTSEGGSGAADFVRLITGRKSRRGGFSARPVLPSVITSIVACGMSAPSSKNARPCRFHPVTDTTLLRSIADAVVACEDLERFVPIDPATGRAHGYDSTVAESAQVLRSVPLAVFIENAAAFSGGRATVANSPPDMRDNALLGYTLEVLGVGAAIQNLWLAAEAHGIQGVFMGDVLIAEDTIRRMLGVRGDLIGVVALGYGEDPAKGSR